MASSHAVARKPRQFALTDEGRSWTYAELDSEVDLVARALMAIGIQQGDRVGIWAPNCAEWTWLQFASAFVGAILVNVNPAYREHELEYTLAQSGVKVWSSGHDVYELPAGGRDPLGWDDPLRELVRAIEECPAPVIAVIEGGVWGGACEVAFACDLIIAAPSATFAVTPARLGVPVIFDVTHSLQLPGEIGRAHV